MIGWGSSAASVVAKSMIHNLRLDAVDSGNGRFQVTLLDMRRFSRRR
jgi:hypothetical protein